MALEVEVVCLDARGWGREQADRSAATRSVTFSFSAMAAGDLVLNREDVSHFAIVPLGPEMVAVGDVDELCGDANPPAGAPHATLEHRGDVELLTDAAEIEVLALEGEGRCPRRHAQAGQLGQGVDDLLGDAIGEILVLGVAADVGEGQHGNGPLELSISDTDFALSAADEPVNGGEPVLGCTGHRGAERCLDVRGTRWAACFVIFGGGWVKR